MDYTSTAQSGNSYTHQWDVATVRVFDGGFLFDKTTVPTGTEKLPRGTFLKVDQTERKATMIKTATLQAALLIGDTAVKVIKGSLLLATDVLGIGTKAVVTGTIDTSNAAYDSFAITAGALGALPVGTVLQQFSAASTSGTKGVHKITIGTNAANTDTLTIDGVVYTFATAAAEGVIAVGGTAIATAANLEDAVSAQYEGVFSVKADGAKLVLTQIVAGVGAIPVISYTGTVAATVATTTAAVAVAGSPVNPDGLNYGDVTIDAQPTCSVIFEVKGIVSSKLPNAPTDAIKVALPFCQFLTT